MNIKRFYATHCKKFLALILSLVCLITAILSPAMVFAHAVEWDEDAQKFVPNYTKIDALMDYIMAGTMGIFPGDFDTFYKEHKQEYEDWYNKVYNYNYPDDDETIHGGGGKELTIKADDMQELYDRRCEKFYVCF